MAENTFLETGVEVPEKTSESQGSAKQVLFGIAFVGGMGAATVLNMSGYPGMAMGFGMISLIGLVTFIGSLQKS